LDIRKKKDKNLSPDDSKDLGTKWVVVAQEAKTKLIISHHEGARDFEDSVELISDVERRRDKNTELPIFTTDDWDPYKNALLEVYSVIEQPEYKGRGRPPNPIKVPLSDLKYAQVVKHKESDEVKTIETKVVFGAEEEVINKLKSDGNTINTSYVERNNLTVRNGVSRLIRDTINFSKIFDMLVAHMCFFFVWFNFVKPHDALKLEITDGRRRWKQRTPAIAANITDHIWTLEELCKFKPPPVY
jgi:IS1 family transposase